MTALIYLPGDLAPVLAYADGPYCLVVRSPLPTGRTLCGQPDGLDQAALLVPGVGALDAGYVCERCCKAMALRDQRKEQQLMERAA